MTVSALIEALSKHPGHIQVTLDGQPLRRIDLDPPEGEHPPRIDLIH